jgi:sulfopropanediol 3-dehydrogenase
MAVYLKKAKERPEQDMQAVSDTVREILERVRREGEAAVRYYSKKFDDWDPPSFRVSKEEMDKARQSLSKKFCRKTA